MARNLQSESLGRTRALPRGQLISSACCVSATALQQPRQGVPRTGRRVQSNFTILSCVVEIGQTNMLTPPFGLKVAPCCGGSSVTPSFVLSPPICENSAGNPGGNLNM